MAKFCGKVGYAFSREIAPDVYDDEVVEKTYYGDVTKNNRRWEKGTDINDDLNVSNTFSIMADAYAYEHFFAIKYIEWMGARWKVTNVEVQRPRLIFSVGGVYNGPTPETQRNP